MLCKFLVAALGLAFSQPCAADDVHLDISKLTQFTTSVRFKAKDLVKDLSILGGSGDAFDPAMARFELGAEFDETIDGQIMANIPGELLKIQLSYRIKRSLGSSLPVFPGVPSGLVPDSVTVTDVFTFDGPKGYVAMEVVGAAPSAKAQVGFSTCGKVSFDSSLLPPPERVQAMINQEAPMWQMMASRSPHTVIGDLAYYGSYAGLRSGYQNPFGVNVVAAVHVSDGTLFGYWFLGHPGDTSTLPSISQAAHLVQGVPPAVKFGDFKDFTASVDEVACKTDISMPQMLKEPRAQQSLFLAEQLLKRLQQTAPLATVFSHLHAPFGSVLNNAGQYPTCSGAAAPILTASPTVQFSPLAAIGIAALCMSSAAVGAGIAVHALRRASYKRDNVYLEIS